MKQIVFVIGNYKNGGVARRSTNLANQLVQHGYDITLLVTKGIDSFIPFHSSIKIILLSEYNQTATKTNRVMRDLKKRNRLVSFYRKMRVLLQYLPWWRNRLSQKINEMRKGKDLRPFILNHPNAVYVGFGIGCYESVYYAAKGLHSQLIYAEKNASQLEFLKEKKERDDLFRILRRGDSAVLQTRDELDFFKGCLKNATVIHNPLIENLPMPYQGIRRPVVVNFCRISEQKNLPLLFEAFRQFHDCFPEYQLEIYGTTVECIEEELKRKYETELEKSGMRTYIQLLPPASDVHQRVLDAAMFVSSSDYEGLSNSMIEAMAIGLPCICTDCLGGGAREVIRNGENGLLVPIKDAATLCEAMKRFAEHPDFAEQCGRNASQIRDELSAEKICQQWIRVIEGKKNS